MGAAVVAALLAVPAHAAAATPQPTSTDTGDASIGVVALTPAGGAPSLAVDTLHRALVRFDVRGTQGIPVARAVLRLWVTDGSIMPTEVRTTPSGFEERTVTSAPSSSGTALASAPSVKAGTWAEYDVTAAVPTDGTVAFVLSGGLLDGARFASKEAGADHAPQLVVTPMTPAQELTYDTSDATPRGDAVQVRFGATDDRGVSLDGLKAIPSPDGNGLIGVSHALVDGVFTTQLVRSGDGLTWTHVRDIASHASQATLAAVGDGTIALAYERDVPDPDPTVVNRSSLVVQRYASVDALLTGAPAPAEYAPARTLSPWSEGTPSFRSIDPLTGSLVLDFHYLSQGSNGAQYVDRQATATMSGWDLGTWATTARTDVDAIFDALGVHGNLGDRDDALFRGQDLALIEGQGKRQDFSTFRLYVLDRARGTGTLVPMHTPGGSTAFGNPSVTLLPGNRLLVTAYVFSEGAAAGEAGEMIMVRKIPADPV